jgi:hypothetical protein
MTPEPNTLTIHRVSCQVCGNISCGLSLKQAKQNHKKHIKKCKITRFWETANKILGRELTRGDIMKLIGAKRR